VQDRGQGRGIQGRGDREDQRGIRDQPDPEDGPSLPGDHHQGLPPSRRHRIQVLPHDRKERLVAPGQGFQGHPLQLRPDRGVPARQVLPEPGGEGSGEGGRAELHGPSRHGPIGLQAHRHSLRRPPDLHAAVPGQQAIRHDPKQPKPLLGPRGGGHLLPNRGEAALGGRPQPLPKPLDPNPRLRLGRGGGKKGRGHRHGPQNGRPPTAQGGSPPPGKRIHAPRLGRTGLRTSR